jgi:hypothetical protein
MEHRKGRQEIARKDRTDSLLSNPADRCAVLDRRLAPPLVSWKYHKGRPATPWPVGGPRAVVLHGTKG